MADWFSKDVFFLKRETGGEGGKKKKTHSAEQ